MKEENKIREEEIKNDDKEENLPIESEEETMSESIKKIEKPSIGILIFFIVIFVLIIAVGFYSKLMFIILQKLRLNYN